MQRRRCLWCCYKGWSALRTLGRKQDEGKDKEEEHSKHGWNFIRAHPLSKVLDLYSPPLIRVPSSRFRDIFDFILRSRLLQLVIVERILRSTLSPQFADRGGYQFPRVLPMIGEPSEVLLYAAC